MGHTVHPMRNVVYSKVDHLGRLCNALREPERSCAQSLLIRAAFNIVQPFGVTIPELTAVCNGQESLASFSQREITAMMKTKIP